MEKPKRQYNSKRRAEAAEQTRRSILAAADRLFRKDGWAKTTIAAIAREASVSGETIYSVFANKRTIIRELIIATVRRDNPDIAVMQQRQPAEVLAGKSAASQIEKFSRDITDILSRVAPLMAIVRTAADLEPELAELYLALQAGRRKNLLVLAGSLGENGEFRQGVDVESAADILWRLASPELFEFISRVEGKDGAAFAGWLSDTLQVLLLPQASAS